MKRLLAQAKLLNQSRIAVVFFAFEVIEQFTTTADHAQQATATMVVFLVGLEVGGQVVDAGSEQSHLDFRGACVVGAAGIGLDNLGLVQIFYGHDVSKNMQAP